MRHQRGWKIRPLGSRQGKRSQDLPAGLCKPRMWTFTIHRQPSLFQDLQYEVAGEVADARDPVREVGPTLHDSSHERARGRRCVNRFSGRFRIHCSTAGMGHPSALTQPGFVALDFSSCGDIFTHWACVMKVPPAFLRGAYRSAMRLALRDHFWHGNRTTR